MTDTPFWVTRLRDELVYARRNLDSARSIMAELADDDVLAEFERTVFAAFAMTTQAVALLDAETTTRRIRELRSKAYV